MSLSEDATPTDDLKAEFRLRDRGAWKVAEVRDALRADKNWKGRLVPYLARPFDVRSVLYSDEVLIRPVRRAQRHMLSGDNLRQPGPAGVPANCSSVPARAGEQTCRYVQRAGQRRAPRLRS